MVYSETEAEFLYNIYMKSCSKTLRTGLVLQKKKKNLQQYLVGSWPLLLRTKRTNSHVPVIMNVAVAPTISPYLFIHSFLGRREKTKHTGCSEDTEALYCVSHEILEHVLCTNTSVGTTGAPVGDTCHPERDRISVSEPL